MASMTSSRKLSFIILALIYIAAFVIGWLSFGWMESFCSNNYLSLFVADVMATVFVWLFGLVYKNVSVYDPYWSVAPPIVLTVWAIYYNNVGMAGILLLIAVWYWGIRLTGNWAYTFRNLDTEDWRYTKYRTEQKPFIFHLINFFGLNMMPTIVVFLAMLPALDLLEGVVVHNEWLYPGNNIRPMMTFVYPCSWVTCIGFIICIVATTIQLISDNQRHRFAKEHKGEVCKVGLWKQGRHPNYFGEIMMWWGVWLMNPLPFLLAGPIAMTCLFLFISIPLMEGRQLKNKPGYAEYKKETRILI